MEAKQMMAYFLLLLGCVAVSSSSECFSFPNYNLATDEMIEQSCRDLPGFGAVIDGYTGAPEDKNGELAAQCKLFEDGYFDGSVPDVEKVEEMIRNYGESDEMKAALDKVLATCDSSLLLSYQAYEYLQCTQKTCEEAMA